MRKSIIRARSEVESAHITKNSSHVVLFVSYHPFWWAILFIQVSAEAVPQEECGACEERAGVEQTEEEEKVEEEVTPPTEEVQFIQPYRKILHSGTPSLS